MVEHQTMTHQGRVDPKFNFRIVKKYGSSLERQVREAVRIQMRGVVLTRKAHITLTCWVLLLNPAVYTKTYQFRMLSLKQA